MRKKYFYDSVYKLQPPRILYHCHATLTVCDWTCWYAALYWQYTAELLYMWPVQELSGMAFKANNWFRMHISKECKQNIIISQCTQNLTKNVLITEPQFQKSTLDNIKAPEFST